MPKVYRKAVIDECQGAVAANELPDCLGNGAVAFELLRIAKQPDGFGPNATQVFEICRERNKTFQSTWTCVENAVEKSLETARLIGKAEINDLCVKALANEDLYDRLSEKEAELRDHFLPDRMFYGGGSYFPFEGCPQEQAGSDGSEESAEAEFLDADGCKAIGDLDTFLESRSDTELRAIIPVLELLPEEQRLSAIAEFGMPAESIEVIRSKLEQDKGNGLALAFIGFGLLERHHAILVKEVMALSSVEDSVSDEFSAGLFSMFTKTALDGYQKTCSR